MPKAWDHRVRQHLGTRYDCKSGCFDWDVTMKLHQKGVRRHFIPFPLSAALLFCHFCRACFLQGGIINKHEYVRWRERGLAFQMREGANKITNPTMISPRVFNQVISYPLTLRPSSPWWRLQVFTCVSTEKEQGGSSGLLGRHRFQSVLGIRHRN